MKDNEIFEYHGYKEQCKHIMEEMYELTDAIRDYESCTEVSELIRNWNYICEEVADVEFMLNQIKEHYRVKKSNVSSWSKYKRKREIDRIKGGYYENRK